MKHCELEGHLCGDTAEGGIGPSSVSFISKAKGRIASFCGFSSVPTEVHHHFRLLLWDKIFGPCLYAYVCETKSYRYTPFLCTILIVVHRIDPAYFFPIFLAAFSWVGLLPRGTVWQQSWWWAMGQGHISSGVSRECCLDFAVNLRPHLCLLSCLHACALNWVCEVLQKALLWKEWSPLAESVEGIGTKYWRRRGRTGNASSQCCLQRIPSMEKCPKALLPVLSVLWCKR